jgi:zinc transport system permease protein
MRRNNMLNTIFEYTFLKNALIGGLLASIICGIIGTIIVEKKLVMLSSGIAHISFGGVGLGFLLNVNPIYSAFVFSIIASLGIVNLKEKFKSYPDAIIGLFWAFGMALGVLFIYINPGYPPDVNSYLFGDILTITSNDLILISFVSLLIIFTVISLYNYWLAYFFDSDFLNVKGINVKFLEYIIFLLISVAIISLIKLVGIILVIALLTIPTLMAKIFVNEFHKIILFSIFFAFIFVYAGLFFSYILNIPSGATIIITSTLVFFISLYVKNSLVLTRE